MEEIWKDIAGYEGEYLVSSLGRVKSLLGKQPRILKPRYNSKGYARVSLHANNDKPIHRLVATAFIENRNNLPEVNHKDENPRNNRADNLEWCSHRYNLNYGTCQVRARAKQAITYPQKNRKDLSKSVICLETGEIFPSINETARSLGISRVLISKVCRGIKRSAGGLTFEWANNKLTDSLQIV